MTEPITEKHVLLSEFVEDVVGLAIDLGITYQDAALALGAAQKLLQAVQANPHIDSAELSRLAIEAIDGAVKGGGEWSESR